MEKSSKKPGAGFWFLFVMTMLLTVALLELNKNTPAAWGAAAALLVLFLLLRRPLLGGRKFLRRFLCWVMLWALLTAALLCVGIVYRLRPALKKSSGMSQVVSLADGKVQGLKSVDGTFEVFTGIPYAAPPVGELRWRAPADPASWEGIRACTHFAPMAMQPRNSEIYNSLTRIIGFHDYRISLDDDYRDAVSEDALYINLWRPAGGGEKLPVLVYVHGGALQTGQPWYADYSGEGLARRGVIVVNFGYRLGVFGFLASEELAEEAPDGSTGNYGLMDQIKALEWVRDNIEAFGGDPDNVTVAGESAGAVCVSALCTSPRAAGLFRRAILESSTCDAPEPQHSFRSMDEALETGRKTLARFHAADIEALRRVDASKLAAAADDNHHLTIDGCLLPMTPYEARQQGVHNEEALLHGFNADEGTPFILFDQANMKNYEQKVRAYFGDEADNVLARWSPATDDEAKSMWSALYSATYFTHGHYCLSRLALEADVPVFEYFFSKTNGRISAWHSGEEVYCYGSIPADSRLYDESDRALMDVFCSFFENFVRTGDPNGSGLPVWKRSTDGTELLELGQHIGMIEDPYLEIDRILDRMQGFESESPERSK